MTDHYETVICLSSTDNEIHRYFMVLYGVYSEDLDEDEPDYIPDAEIEIREVSEDEVKMLNDKTIDHSKIGVSVCSLSGWLIMSTYMSGDGNDPHFLCDAHSQDLEYCWSALTDPTISELSQWEDQGNIFYIYTIEVEPDYQPENDKTRIITVLLAKIIQFIYDAVTAREVIPGSTEDERIINGGSHCIDTVAFYPRPLPYDDKIQRMQTDIACNIVSKVRGDILEKMLNPESANKHPDIEVRVSPELYLRANGMRVSGDTYPESAKNRVEWDLLEAAGWHECGNSRLLYKTYSDN